MKQFILIVAVLCLSCIGKLAEEQAGRKKETKPMKEIYLAGGCFWGTEHFLKQIDGVEKTQVGYANGNVVSPTYQQVCTGTTGFAETVKVQYDPEKADLPFLIDLFFKTIDPTSLNKQGGDRGTQYRTGIYYTDAVDLPVIKETVKRLSAGYTRPLVVEIKALENFYPAEDYHQNYLDKNPGGYCHINPALFDVARKAKMKRSK
ncbi:peptide-methionine (S)-S-oxide reductase MsrA [Bacteroides helcogenes]|uniref:Peptide methionine sulfoxide reductase MsrA n=1 Tax=Bacteroides helcogenes (strain ATCC 35417 / DSM 20613 / JCM 6297 / CCUG 15421 / P 36-108) TaxID=693979 RepID=E6SRM6_BACT6|nr:peptide-methionine (S)-S-oxide reductase MsrA [Bacteroides helcogenes]ADV45116.1 peptide methionine sulfoxide reductase [Bacteroides helcogenes P 36-108]MDY5238674.1 peptide-methionine (S)-S-oxide reductase MsrA [Bacteroides helcogenes]